MIGQKFILRKPITGTLKISDFHLIEELVKEVENGEIVVKAEWLSMDPFIRIAISALKSGDTIPGAQVGRVVVSKCAEFPIGTQVIGKFGWREYTVYKPDSTVPRSWQTIVRLDDMKGLPSSYALGALGMPGNTAYFGFVDVMNPKEGETILVSSASGAIGSLLGQIAKIKGCKVIGLTGSDAKIEWLKKDCGFDSVLNYKKITSIQESLKEHAPQGIDCYFDNVGGELTYNVMECMNNLGRVAVCGSMALYNDEPAADLKLYCGPLNLRIKNLSVLGFNTGRWVERWSEGINQLRDWILEGKLKIRETVTNGFENTPQAFLDMLEGKNIGKQLVKVDV